MSGNGSEHWSALEIRLLAAFVAVVEHQSFTGAAHHLGYTQSGISQQVANLERIVGQRLLVREFRGRRPIEPTPVGKTFLEHCRNILRQLEDAYEDIAGCELNAGATIRIASMTSVAVRLVPALEQAVREESSLRILLHEALVDEHLYGYLDARQAELAFTALPVPGRFSFTEIGRDRYVAVVSAESRLARLGAVGVEQLRGVPLLGIRRCAHEELVENRLASCGLNVSAFSRYDDNRLIQALVATGNWIAIVPSLTVDETDDSVRVLQIAGDLPPRIIVLVEHRDAVLSPAGREFKSLALPICRRLLAGDRSTRARAS